MICQCGNAKVFHWLAHNCPYPYYGNDPKEVKAWKDAQWQMLSRPTQRTADRCHGCGALWAIADVVERGNHVCSVCGTRR